MKYEYFYEAYNRGFVHGVFTGGFIMVIIGVAIGLGL